MYSISNPVRVSIGKGSLSNLPSLTRNKKYAVISSSGFKQRGWHNYFSSEVIVLDAVSPNPTVTELSTYVEKLKKIKCNTLVAIGGGSVLDTAKALSVLHDSSKESIFEYLQGKKVCILKKYDLIAIPTTAGTGAEVTPFATIWDDKNKKKMSLYSHLIYPTNAIVDPNLALSLDAKNSAISGLDALSHCFESLWNKNANPLSRSMAFHAIDLILETLGPLLESLDDIEMRSNMAWASLLGGYCINMTKTALAHSISYPLTSHLSIPHGLASGGFLREILKFNKENDQTNTIKKIYEKLFKKESLDVRLNKLYSKIEKHGLFSSFIDKKLAIESLVPEMINPERSRNNIVNASINDIQNIIKNKFKNIS